MGAAAAALQGPEETPPCMTAPIPPADPRAALVDALEAWERGCRERVRLYQSLPSLTHPGSTMIPSGSSAPPPGPTTTGR